MSDQTFTARHLPWAKIGATIDDPHVTSAEAIKLGGLDFDVELLPVRYYREHDGIDEDAEGSGEYVDISTRRAVVRQDTNEWFGIVSTDYALLQYREAFEFLDAISPRYVAAGTLSGGKQGFVIVQLPGHELLDLTPGGESDPQQLYALVRTSHDLSKAIEVAVLTLRNKCMNQLTLPSLSNDAPQRWTVRHVGDPRGKLREAQRVLTGSTRYAEVISARVNQLVSVHATGDDVRAILRRVLRDSLTRKDDMIDEILSMSSRDTVGFQGTGWGWVNTVSEYFQWGRSTSTRTAQSIFTSSLDGDGAKYVNKVATALLARA